MKEFIEDLVSTLEWLLAGCPKPQLIPIPVTEDKDGIHNQGRRPTDNNAKRLS